MGKILFEYTECFGGSTIYDFQHLVVRISDRTIKLVSIHETSLSGGNAKYGITTTTTEYILHFEDKKDVEEFRKRFLNNQNIRVSLSEIRDVKGFINYQNYNAKLIYEQPE